MTRSGFFLALCLSAVVAVGSLCLATNHGVEGEQSSVENSLAVQKAVSQARDYLLHEEAKKAVDVLEANLSRINGDRKYLALLRDAYRACIKDMALAHQPDKADVYQNRLNILDETGANPLAAGGAAIAQGTTSPAAAQGTASPTPGQGAAKPAASQATSGPALAKPTPTNNPPKQAPTPGIVAKADALPANPAPAAALRPKVDPFDAANELKTEASAFLDQPSPAKGLLAKAETEFAQKNYAAAKLLYEQAAKVDPMSVDEDCRKRWAYCQLALVVDRVNRFPEQPCDWNQLEAEVKYAVTVAPHFQRTGEEILGNMAKRRNASPAPVVRGVPSIVVKHLPKGDHGWLVAESAHFRIFHNQTKEYAENVAQTAEFTRSQMARKWFGKELEDWPLKCDIYLHASAADYSRQTGEQPGSPGHSRIELDTKSGRVVVRQMHLRCDNASLLDAILPHETTHVVLAGQFGKNHVPRWADEGVAVLSEPAEKVQQHRKNLAKSLDAYQLIQMRELLQMDAYPPAGQISTFYAQSVALVDYLTKQKGPVVLTQFIREALQNGYGPALQKYYDYKSQDPVRELQNNFTASLLAEINGTSPAIAERQGN